MTSLKKWPLNLPLFKGNLRWTRYTGTNKRRHLASKTAHFIIKLPHKAEFLLRNRQLSQGFLNFTHAINQSLMKLTALITGLLLSLMSFGQKLTTKQLIQFWSASDTSQTTKAEITYADLKHNKDLKTFNRRLFELYTYLSHHANNRLLIRTWIYEVLGKSEFKINFSATDKLHMQKGQKMAGLMEDDQLLSELFSLYPRMSSPYDNSYYTLRSLEIQRRIGMEHFPLFYLRLINFSISMYNVGEYKAAIDYGKNALELLENKGGKDALQRRVLQLDYVGASYKQLDNPDSVDYYYRQLQKYALQFKDSILKKIWLGIAKGGMGYSLIMENHYAAARPLVEANLASSLKYGQMQDAAMARSALAEIDFASKKYQKALVGWQQAYKWYDQDLLGKLQVSHSLGVIFNKLGDFDSSLYYYQRYAEYKIQFNQQNNREKSDVLQSRIEFNKMDGALQVAKKDIRTEKNIRLAILTGLVLLGIIAILIYNRSRIKHKLALEKVQTQQRLAELEIRKAKEQIKTFTERIKKSEALIVELKALQHADNNPSPNLEEKLLAFTLVTNEGWEDFRIEFIKAYPAFYPALQKLAGNLTPAEERLAALIHLQLNNTEIAGSLGIAKESVSRSKRRLKTRLNLSEKDSLELFLTQMAPMDQN